MKPSSNPENSEIVFFDGVCTLCNNFVNYLMPRTELKFASLQGKTAKKLLPKFYSEGLPSMIFYRAGKIEIESTAALHILIKVAGWYKLFGVFLLLPTSFRDLFYRWIADNRYKWFGKQETCRMPTPQERERFFD